MTHSSLENLKRLAAARTPAPWRWDKDNMGTIEGGPENKIVIDTECRGLPPDDNDTDFIIAAANNFEKLLAVCEAAKRLRDDYFSGNKSEAFWEMDTALNVLESAEGGARGDE